MQKVNISNILGSIYIQMAKWKIAETNQSAYEKRLRRIVLKQIKWNMKPDYVYNKFKKFMRESCPALPCMRLHDLRAGYASIAEDLNFNENNLTAALGHSSIVTTKKHYIKAFDDSLRKDVDRLEEAFESTKIAE